MSNAQNISSWFTRFDAFIDARVPDIVAETATEFFVESFQKQSWSGAAWQPLSAKYAKRVRRSTGRILTRSGGLQRSIRPEIVTPSKVRISAGNEKVPYARVHNEGFAGTQVVRAFTRRDGKAVKGHTRFQRIPKRQYMGSTAILRDSIVARIKLAAKRI